MNIINMIDDWFPNNILKKCDFWNYLRKAQTLVPFLLAWQKRICQRITSHHLRIDRTLPCEVTIFFFHIHLECKSRDDYKQSLFVPFHWQTTVKLYSTFPLLKKWLSFGKRTIIMGPNAFHFLEYPVVLVLGFLKIISFSC